jgi:hypothetical protein
MNNNKQKEKSSPSISDYNSIKHKRKQNRSETTEEDTKKRNELLSSLNLKTSALSQHANLMNQNSKSSSSLRNIHNNNNKTITNISTSMVIDSNKETLYNRLISYQQELENTKCILQDQEKVYDNKIDELQETFKTEYEKLKKKHNEVITNLQNENNHRIKALLSKNKELTENNAKLFEQNNLYIEQINKLKSEYDEKIFQLERENAKLKNEKEYLINYYQNKLNVNTAHANIDKKSLSDKYEKVIAGMKDSFGISKQNFMNILKERENEVQCYVDVYKKEKDQLSKQMNDQLNKYEQLNKQHINILHNNKTQNAEIENLKIELQNIKNELNDTIKEKNILEEQCDALIKDNNILRNFNVELNRVTHGKFIAKSKSRLSTMNYKET